MWYSQRMTRRRKLWSQAIKAFDPPSPAVSTQRAPVLGDAAVAALGRHHFNAVSFFKLGVQLVGIVSLVADQPLRQLVQELPASASCTNWHTADEALSTATA